MIRKTLAAAILTLGLAAFATPAIAEMGFNTVDTRRWLERDHAQHRMTRTQEMLHELKAAREAAHRNSDRIQASKRDEDKLLHDAVVWDYRTSHQVAKNETPVPKK